jgi:hypothetical protein
MSNSLIPRVATRADDEGGRTKVIFDVLYDP